MSRRAPAANRAIRLARSVIVSVVGTGAGTRHATGAFALGLRTGMRAT
ncbi:hypothetical protein ACGF0J_30210 [Nonomuraea sp. NPDC047897]